MSSSHGSLAAFSASWMIALTTFLHSSCANITAPSISSSVSSLASDSTIITASCGGGDDEVEAAFGERAGLRRVEDVLAVARSRRGSRRSGP